MGPALGESEEHRLKCMEKCEKRQEGVQRDGNLSMQALTEFKDQTFWVLIILRCMIIRYNT